jgi:hypothetical protein
MNSPARMLCSRMPMAMAMAIAMIEALAESASSGAY